VLADGVLSAFFERDMADLGLLERSIGSSLQAPEREEIAA
jgi:hypothetical protein